MMVIWSWSLKTCLRSIVPFTRHISCLLILMLKCISFLFSTCTKAGVYYMARLIFQNYFLKRELLFWPPKCHVLRLKCHSHIFFNCKIVTLEKASTCQCLTMWTLTRDLGNVWKCNWRLKKNLLVPCISLIPYSEKQKSNNEKQTSI